MLYSINCWTQELNLTGEDPIDYQIWRRMGKYPKGTICKAYRKNNGKTLFLEFSDGYIHQTDDGYLPYIEFLPSITGSLDMDFYSAIEEATWELEKEKNSKQ